MVELMDKWMAFNAKNTNCLKWGLYINSYSSQINWCCFFSVSFKKTNWLMSVFKCYWENAKRSWWSWGNFIFDFIYTICRYNNFFFVKKPFTLVYFAILHTSSYWIVCFFVIVIGDRADLYFFCSSFFFPALNA